jgi:formate-dependent nitrite reductase membrane component NrfD
VLAGVVIALTRNAPFHGTQGLQAMWIVCAAAALGSLVFLTWLQRASRDREALERR